MTDAKGWTELQILLTLGGVFGAIAVLAVAFYLWNRRLEAEHDDSVAAWAARRGFSFDPGPATGADVGTGSQLGDTKITHIIRGVVDGRPLLIFDSKRWVRRTGRGTSGSISPWEETFALFAVETPMPRLVVRSLIAAQPGSVAKTATALLRALPEGNPVVSGDGLLRIPYEAFPGMVVESNDQRATRALLDHGLLQALSERPGWRLYGDGGTFLVTWNTNPGVPNGTSLDVGRRDQFVAGALQLAEIVRTAARQQR